MTTNQVDLENLKVVGGAREGEHVSVRDAVLVIINQAYGPTGEKLVGVSDVTFDGFPAVTLLVRSGEQEGLVHLSPIHGDRRKQGVELPSGAKCELMCPVSRVPLQKIGKIDDHSDAEYYAIYLSDKLTEASAVFISDVWDHYESRVVDNDELISTWMGGQE